MTGFVWEDPPERAGRRAGTPQGVWAARLAPAKEQPGRWARVHGPVAVPRAYKVATELRAGAYKGFDPSEWEIVARTLSDGQGYIYARYLGAPTIVSKDENLGGNKNGKS